MNMNATIFGQAIAFILFVWFCMKFVWPPIIQAIEKRQKEIADDLAAAEKAQKEVGSAKAEALEILQGAKADASIIIEQAYKRKAEIVEEAKNEAESEKEKIIKQGFAELDAERKRTQEKLRKQIAVLALTGAEKIIERSIDEAANSDIIDKLTAEL